MAYPGSRIHPLAPLQVHWGKLGREVGAKEEGFHAESHGGTATDWAGELTTASDWDSTDLTLATDSWVLESVRGWQQEMPGT